MTYWGRALGVGAAAVCLLGAKTPPATHAVQDISPAWSHVPVSAWNANQSYLSRRDLNGLSAPMALLDGLLDPMDVFEPGQINEMRQQYELMAQRYDTQQVTHTGGHDPDAEYKADMKGLSDRVGAAAGKHQGDKGIDRVRRLTHNGRDIPMSAKVVGAIAVLGTGQPVDARVADGVSVHAAAHLPMQISYMQVSSPWLNSDVSVTGGGGDGGFTSRFHRPPDWVPRGERYHIGFSRQLPLWSLQSGVSYGGTSQTLGANLSKALTPHLTASIGSVYGLSADTGAAPLDQRVEMHYEIHF